MQKGNTNTILIVIVIIILLVLGWWWYANNQKATTDETNDGDSLEVNVGTGDTGTESTTGY